MQGEGGRSHNVYWQDLKLEKCVFGLVIYFYRPYNRYEDLTISPQPSVFVAHSFICYFNFYLNVQRKDINLENIILKDVLKGHETWSLGEAGRQQVLSAMKLLILC